jgi:hypothetical protein
MIINVAQFSSVPSVFFQNRAIGIVQIFGPFLQDPENITATNGASRSFELLASCNYVAVTVVEGSLCYVNLKATSEAAISAGAGLPAKDFVVLERPSHLPHLKIWAVS